MALPLPPVLIGQPVGDGDCDLFGYIYRPNPDQYPGPRPAVVGTVAGLFKQGNLNSLNNAFTDLSAVGFICMAFSVRLTEPGQLEGQTTDGKYPLQTDDMKIGIRYMRALTDDCNGFVATIGGSGSAHHAIYKCLSGTLNDDLADAAIGLSTVTDMGDRDAGVSQQFIDTCEFYGKSTVAATLTAQSPIALIATAVNPIPPMFFSNGLSESMPYSQLVKFAAALDLEGVTNYVARTNTSNEHSYQTWNECRNDAITFMLNAAAVWDGGTEAPSKGFRLTLTGGPYTLVGAFNNSILPESARSVTITDLNPATMYSGELIHFDNTLPEGKRLSDPAIATFTSGSGVKGGIPSGTYHLLSAPEGYFWTDFNENEVTLDFPHITGYRGRAQMNSIMGGELFTYTFSALDDARDIMAAAGKKLGLSCGVGTSATVEWYDEGGDDEVPKFEIDPLYISPQAYQPVFWDPNHLAKMQQFTSDLGEKFDGDPVISYFVISGFMWGTQGFVSGTDLDDDKWDQLALDYGYADKVEAYLDAAKTITGYWMDAFPNTQLYFTQGKPWGDSDGQAAQNQFLDWIRNSTEHRVGSMTTGLHAKIAPYNPPSVADYPLGAQAIFGSNDEDRFYGDIPPDPYPEAPQLISDLLFGSCLPQGRTFCEIYNVDAREPLNAETITAANAALALIVPTFPSP